MASWIACVGVWVELPLLVNVMPEVRSNWGKIEVIFWYLGLDTGIKNVFNSAIGKHYTTDHYHYQDQKAQMAQLPENGELIGQLSDISSDTLSDIVIHHRTLFSVIKEIVQTPK